MLTFEIKNIGLVKEASIQVGGLTILTGENDTGKSTVCKAIFCLLEVLEKFNNVKAEDKNELKLQNLRGKYLQLAFAFIFKGQVLNLNESINFEPAELSIKDICKLELRGIGLSTSIDLEGAEQYFKVLKIIEFPTSSYIESPLTIQQFKFIKNSLADLTDRLREQKAIIIDLPRWIEDLVKKLNLNARVKIELEDKMQKVYEEISHLINGEVAYDGQKDDYVFRKKGLQTSFEITNTATGIKSFGLLQALIQASAISSKSVLIIDEPEVHLHPKWQLEYAKILIKLTEAGVPVIVSSHSPYMIEALKTYTHKSLIKDQTRFYFAEMTDEGSIFKDCSNDLEPIFRALSEPMRKLAFE